MKTEERHDFEFLNFLMQNSICVFLVRFLEHNTNGKSCKATIVRKMMSSVGSKQFCLSPNESNQSNL